MLYLKLIQVIGKNLSLRKQSSLLKIVYFLDYNAHPCYKRSENWWVQAGFSLQCRCIFGAGALNNPSLLSSWARKRERAGASQK